MKLPRKGRWEKRRENPNYRRQAVPVATLILIAFNVAVHFIITGGTFWIAPDIKVLSTFGLNQKFPILSLLTYHALHLWPSHLIVDMLLLLAFGTLVERRIGWRTTLLVYFAAAITGGLVHVSTSNAVLVGSSIGVFGLVGAAIIINPLFSIVGLLVMPTLTFWASERIDAIEETQRTRLEHVHANVTESLSNVTREIENTSETNAVLLNASATLSAELEKYNTKLSEAGESLAKGNISREEYQNISTAIIENKTKTETKLLEIHTEITQVETKINQLSEKNQSIHAELTTVSRGVEKFEATKKLREEAPSAILMHIVGMFTGYGCILLFAPEALNPWSEKIGWFLGLFLNRNHKGRKRKNRKFRQA